jgi:hypothetical protein
MIFQPLILILADRALIFQLTAVTVSGELSYCLSLGWW